MRLVYRECLDLELPAYAGDQVARSILGERQAWLELAPEAAIAGDVVFARRTGRPFHLGVLLEGGRVLHCDTGFDVTAPRLADCRGWSCTFWRYP